MRRSTTDARWETWDDEGETPEGGDDDGEVASSREDDDPHREDDDPEPWERRALLPPPDAPGRGPSASGIRLTERPYTSIEDIFARCSKRVWQLLCRRGVDPDAAEQMHSQVFMTMNTYLEQHGMPERVPAMLATMARNLLRNHLRDEQRKGWFRAEGVDPDAMPASQRDMEQRMYGAEAHRLVEAALLEIPFDAADLIDAIDLAELSHQDMAWILGRPLETVRTQHRRARERLRVALERLMERRLAGGDGR
jgi:RNA polymerase sigma-70 factor (ECF subfamily)